MFVNSIYEFFHTNGKDHLDFEEFCKRLAILCLTSKDIKSRILFSFLDYHNKGFIKGKFLKIFVKYLTNFVIPVLNTPSDENSNLEIKNKSTKINNKLLKKLKEKNLNEQRRSLIFLKNQIQNDNYNFKEFNIWANEFFQIDEFFSSLFEIVPTALAEMQILKKINEVDSDKSLYKKEKKWFLVSFKWWEMWKLYISEELRRIKVDNEEFYDFEQDLEIASENNDGSTIEKKIKKINRKITTNIMNNLNKNHSDLYKKRNESKDSALLKSSNYFANDEEIILQDYKFF